MGLLVVSELKPDPTAAVDGVAAAEATLRVENPSPAQHKQNSMDGIFIGSTTTSTTVSEQETNREQSMMNERMFYHRLALVEPTTNVCSTTTTTTDTVPTKETTMVPSTATTTHDTGALSPVNAVGEIGLRYVTPMPNTNNGLLLLTSAAAAVSSSSSGPSSLSSIAKPDPHSTLTPMTIDTASSAGCVLSSIATPSIISNTAIRCSSRLTTLKRKDADCATPRNEIGDDTNKENEGLPNENDENATFRISDSIDRIVLGDRVGNNRTNPLHCDTYDTSLFFPIIIHRMIQRVNLSDPAVMHWNKTGDHFWVDQVHAQLGRILKIFFKHGNYQSLRRQLNAYRFTKALDGPYKGYWRRPAFYKWSSFDNLMYDGPVKITRPNLSRHRTMGMEMHVSAPVATPPFPVPFGQFDSAQAASQFVAGQVHLPNKRICTMTIRQNAIYCASVKSSAGTLCKTASPGSVGTPARLDFTCSTTSSTEDSTTEEIDKFAKVEPDTTSNLVTKTVNASSFRSIDSRSSVSDIQSEEPQEALKLDISVDAAHIFVPTPIKAVYQDLCQVFAHSPSPFTMRFPLGGGDSVSECSIRCSPFQSSCMSAFSPISIAAINQPSPTDFYELKDGRFHSAVIVGTTNLGCDPSDCTSMSSMDNVDDGASTFSRMSPVGGDLSHPLDMSMICVDGTDEIVPCQLFLTI